MNPANPCRCSRRVRRAIEVGRVDPEHLLFVGRPAMAHRDAETLEHVQEMEALERAAAVFQSHPAYAAPGAFLDGLRALIASGDYQVLSD